MLIIVEDYNQLKSDFSNKFQLVLNENLDLRDFIYELFVYSTAYVVGGFIRDIILKKQSRDIDMIVNIPFQRLLSLIKSSNLNFRSNR
ncbi:MAG: hypothetical protein PHY08_14495 [Candidatus Cloacimonetes bacterium]|nr:hypothetical protein [Candidatus Cloacimonadota bacterium]